MRIGTSTVAPGHPDFPTLDRIRTAILEKVGGQAALELALPELCRDAVEFVIDPVRTARTRVSELDNVEKTFVGLKVEHFFRDLLDVPKGVRDLEIDGVDVDVKNTVHSKWTIPPETYRTADPCILIATAQETGLCRLGLILAHVEYLGKENRDRKRGAGKAAHPHILWLVEGVPFPRSRWEGIDMARFRDLRRVRGGTVRAAQFFRENLGVRVHRSIVQALLFDQHDYMKRLRGNGGARDVLGPEGIALLSGAYDARWVEALGLPSIDTDEWIAVRPDAPEHVELLRGAGLVT